VNPNPQVSLIFLSAGINPQAKKVPGACYATWLHALHANLNTTKNLGHRSRLYAMAPRNDIFDALIL